MAELRKGSYRYKDAEVDSTIMEKAEMEHGAYYIAAHPDLFEVQRPNTFEFCVYGLNGIEQAPGASNLYAVDNAEDVIRVAVISAPVPHYQQSPIEVKRGNSTIKFADVPTFSNGSLTLNDYIGAGVLEALMAWQNKSYNVETEKVGLAFDYKKDCTLTEYTPTWQPVRQWRLYGCWISNITEQEFSYEQTGKRNVTAEIQYDYAKLESVD